jgi:hypothetical protein
VESEAYRALADQRQGLKQQQGHLLVEQERSARHAAARQKRLEQLAEAGMTGQTPDLTAEREQELTPGASWPWSPCCLAF